MKIKHALCLAVAVISLTACKEEKPSADASSAEARTDTKAPSAKKEQKKSDLFFVCQMSNDSLAYLSVMERGHPGATNESMAASFKKKVESLDRTYYPLPEGMIASCESSSDQLTMANRALDIRDETMSQGKSFRSVTGWQP